MRKPTALKENDYIGIVAPASPAPVEKIQLAKEMLQSIRYRVKIGKSCYAKSIDYLAAEDKIRSEDLNNMFYDKQIKAIICLRGGFGSTRILPKLDYKIIKQNPKIFIGYSDITAIHIAIQQKSKLITFHGPMAATEIAEGLNPFTKQSLLKNITTSYPIGKIKNSHDKKIEILVKGTAQGRITGGNLSVICALMGTPYEVQTKGKILFLEDIAEEPYKVDRMLTQLYLAGKLQAAEGFILGDWKDCGELREVFLKHLSYIKKPTLFNIQAGHCNPQLTIPLGLRVTINCKSNGEGELILMEGGVKL